MKTLIMALVLALVLLTVANAQSAGENFDSFPVISVTDTTVVSQHSAQTQDQVPSDFTDDLMEDERIEEANDRSTSLLLAAIVSYIIFMFTLSGK